MHCIKLNQEMNRQNKTEGRVLNWRTVCELDGQALPKMAGPVNNVHYRTSLPAARNTF